MNRHAWHDVAVFDSMDNGKALEAILREKGFEARTYDDKWFRYFLFLRPPMVTYRVQVRKNHMEGANKFLAASSPAILSRAVHCPECESMRVNYPQMTRQFVLPTILLHLGIIFRAVDHQCYCEHCQHMWSLPGDKSAIHKTRDVKPFPF
jgi:hypothetical protein